MIDSSAVFPLVAQRLGSEVTFNTLVASSPHSGNEARAPYRDQSRRLFNAVAGIKRLPDVRALDAFFMAMRGPLVGFLLKDWRDFAATRLAATHASGVTTQGRATVISGAVWQMEKWYTAGSQTHRRRIRRPVSPSAVYFDGVLKTVTTHYTVDYSTGQLTVVSGSPSSVEWEGDFNCEVRFGEDRLPAELFKLTADTVPKGLADLVTVPLVELIGEELN